MAYVALYRKYRSQNFNEVAGQKHIVKTLENALINNSISHAYLFCGPRGTGKTTMARILAKALNCEHGFGSVCNNCENCNLINSNSHPDVIEIDAASNSRVEEMRNVIEKVKYAPIKGRYKVFIIDEVHMLSNSAFNALLKTLEEPPKDVCFILATTEPHKVLPTILSRCQRFDFTKISDSDMKELLNKILTSEGISCDEESINEIISLADGCARDALSILDQLIAFCGNTINIDQVRSVFGLVSVKEKIDLLRSILVGNLDEVLKKYNFFTKKGVDILKFNEDLLQITKDALIYKVTNKEELLKIIKNKNNLDIFNNASIKDLNNMIDVFIESNNNLKNTSNLFSLYEICLIKLTSLFKLHVINEPNKIEEKVTKEENTTIESNFNKDKNDLNADIVNNDIEEEDESLKTEENIPEEKEDNTDLVLEAKPNQDPTRTQVIKQIYKENQNYHENKDYTPLKKEDLQSFDDEIILRAIILSSKDRKINLFNKWSRLNEIGLNPSYAICCAKLKSCTLFSFCDELLILQTQFVSIIDFINNKENTATISNILNELIGIKLKVYAISFSEARRLQQLYYNLREIDKLPKKSQIKGVFE